MLSGSGLVLPGPIGPSRQWPIRRAVGIDGAVAKERVSLQQFPGDESLSAPSIVRLGLCSTVAVARLLNKLCKQEASVKAPGARLAQREQQCDASQARGRPGCDSEAALHAGASGVRADEYRDRRPANAGEGEQ